MESAFGVEHGDFSKGIGGALGDFGRGVRQLATGKSAARAVNATPWPTHVEPIKAPWETGGSTARIGPGAKKPGPGQSLPKLGGGNAGKLGPASVSNGSSMRTMGLGASPAKSVSNKLGPVNSGVKPKWSI